MASFVSRLGAVLVVSVVVALLVAFSSAGASQAASSADYVPVVLWHGMAQRVGMPLARSLSHKLLLGGGSPTQAWATRVASRSAWATSRS